MPEDVHLALETEFKFEGYLARQEDEVKKLKRNEAMLIPADFCYPNCDGLTIELREKLARFRPFTLAQATKIPGMTPAALSLLAVYLERHRRAKLQTEAAN